MEELVRFLVTELSECKDQVSVTREDDKINVLVAKQDMGKVIGKQGRIAKAIRTIVKAAAAREGKKYTIEIGEIS